MRPRAEQMLSKSFTTELHSYNRCRSCNRWWLFFREMWPLDAVKSLQPWSGAVTLKTATRVQLAVWLWVRSLPSEQVGDVLRKRGAFVKCWVAISWQKLGVYDVDRWGTFFFVGSNMGYLEGLPITEGICVPLALCSCLLSPSLATELEMIRLWWPGLGSSTLFKPLSLGPILCALFETHLIIYPDRYRSYQLTYHSGYLLGTLEKEIITVAWAWLMWTNISSLTLPVYIWICVHVCVVCAHVTVSVHTYTYTCVEIRGGHRVSCFVILRYSLDTDEPGQLEF